MSENKSPLSSSDSYPTSDSFLDDGDTSGAGSPLVDPSLYDQTEDQTEGAEEEQRTTEQMTLESVMPDSLPPSESQLSGDIDLAEPDDMWDVVDNLPGTVPTLEAPETGRTIDTPVSATPSERETELLTLIHDLNECNDVLLARVSQLESALEKSQQIFQGETEKVAEQARIAQDKMAQQASEQQALAQQASQNAQQQIAKVIDQLETAEQALQRQQLVNETLQAELNNAQERITQLEHEGALTAQQHAAEAQARVQAETANRDLRSRLQRQQRYTLQFKAALEKSLTVTAKPTSSSTPSTVGKPTSFQDPSSVSMPKAQRIVPWASAGAASPFEGIDPHLENLIRSAVQPSREADLRPTASAQADAVHNETDSQLPSTGEPIADPEAEAKLWQDLERVMDTATEVATTEVVTTEVVTEVTVEASTSEASKDVMTETSTVAGATDQGVSGQVADAQTGFTEPSPWDGQAIAQQTHKIPSAEDSSPKSDVAAAGGDTSSVSPVVDPLRAKKKKPRSLSSIQLPTFEKAKAGSFKR
ncbi:MAG: hypothetical protein AAFQ74_20090 [Cyanobacteria bacterium J06623_4]